jgi:hypothetical protein
MPSTLPWHGTGIERRQKARPLVERGYDRFDQLPAILRQVLNDRAHGRQAYSDEVRCLKELPRIPCSTTL